MKNAKPNDEIDKAFLSVFFAVCACASGLLPQAQGSSTLVGIEYYQKSLLLYFASSGEVFLEQVQCLGLLAFCSASWNVLAQSWRFAGQAVRIAQDLGLHVSSLVDTTREPNEEPYNLCEYRDAQIARCVWWSVFGIDCISSICLGRPMAADVAHCCCDLPTNISNEDLEQGCGPNDQSNSSLSSPMAGFIAFTQLCKIAAEVHRFHSSFRLRSRNASNTSMKEALPTVNILIRELDNWLQELPDEIKFSANSLQRGPNLTMSVVVFILHSATIMNLYRFVYLQGSPRCFKLEQNFSFLHFSNNEIMQTTCGIGI
ncbi:hypothetical protein N7456_002516 [Penicillium angulare]|uniref:Xylanolytic transcriptional activator regulatory domain-containing protein n=1 Tax=Penicillium angulare TaxID=116970 RepID=A0A9W9G8K1_9EURO|nr:hypothetical protein N7456_002516 [Penicillium angulare]